jgi:hypothetical protein
LIRIAILADKKVEEAVLVKEELVCALSNKGSCKESAVIGHSLLRDSKKN